MNNKNKTAIWVLVALIILALIAYPKIKSLGSGTEKKAGKSKQQSALVKTEVLRPSLLRELVKTSGALLADEEVDLTFEITGKIEKIYFAEGLMVNKGQLLAKLNDDDLKAQMAKLELQNKLLSEKVDRQKVLLQKEAISQESYDQMMTDLQTNDAEIKLLKVRIDKTTINAPFQGVVGLRYISEGAYVNPGTRIAKLIKNQPLKIEFSIPEKYSEIVKTGYDLQFIAENSSAAYTAKVYAIEPTIDAKTRTISLRALFPNSDNRLKPGRYVAIELIIREKKDALQVPTEAIIPELGKEKVFIVKNGKASAVIIKTGLRTDKTIEVTDGLNAGDSIVVSGIMQLQQDMPVIVNNEK